MAEKPVEPMLSVAVGLWKRRGLLLLNTLSSFLRSIVEYLVDRRRKTAIKSG